MRLQGSFVCFEANLGSNSNGLPLLVVALTEKQLNWEKYAKQYKAHSLPESAEVQGHRSSRTLQCCGVRSSRQGEALVP